MVAVAQPKPDTWSAEWFGTTDPQATSPWLFDAGGNPIEFSEDVIGHRARFLPPGSRGMGELVLDERTGLPLLIARGIGPEEFCSLVRYRPGRYRLAAVDERHQYMRDAPIACFTITPTMAAAAAHSNYGPTGASSPATPSAGDSALVLELVNALRAIVSDREKSLSSALVETLGVIKAQSSDGARGLSELVRASATVVTAADGAGISRRDPLPVPPAPAPVPAPAPPAPAADEPAQPIAEAIGMVVDKFGPALNHVINTKVLGLSDDASAALIRAQAQAKGGAPVTTSAPAQPTAPAAPAPASAASSTTAPATQAELDPATYDSLVALMPVIARDLAPHEINLISQYIATAPPEHKHALASEVLRRSVPDAVVWIRSLLAGAPSAAPDATATASGR